MTLCGQIHVCMIVVDIPAEHLVVAAMIVVDVPGVSYI